MPYESQVANRSFLATSSLVSKQFTFVDVDTSGGISSSTSGGDAIGVVQDKPAAASPGAVCRPGDITKIVAGGTFAAGDKLMSDSAGKAVVATTGGYILGKALAAGASGKVTTMVFQPDGSKR